MDQMKPAARKGNWFNRAVDVLADIFVPLIPIILGGGLLMAVYNILAAEGLFGEQSVIERFPAWDGVAGLIHLLAAAPFTFLPVLVGFTATKRFGGNEFLGAGLAMAMVMPELVSGYDVADTIQSGDMPYWHIFGLDVAQAGYHGSILPILVIAWILASIEKFLHRHLRGTVDFMLTPVITLLITGFITFLGLGPVLRSAGDWLGVGLANLYEFAGPVGGFVFGLLYSPLVLTGLHQSFPAIETVLWNEGGSFILPIASMANIAQGGAALGVYAVSHSPKLRGLAGAAGVSALFGVTEPAVFGINLRLRWPFYIGMAASAVASTCIALTGVRADALGSSSVLGFLSTPRFALAFVLCSAISLVVSFATAYIYGRVVMARRGSIDADQSGPDITRGETATDEALEVAAPLVGKVIPLEDVSDSSFASGQLGAGVAIEPSEGCLVSPVDGRVVVISPSMHAYAVRTNDPVVGEVEVLMHVGFDTVNLKGKYFVSHVSKGDEVRQGELLAEFDLKAIEAAGYPVTTPVIISNSEQTGPVIPATPAGTLAQHGKTLLTVDPKLEP